LTITSIALLSVLLISPTDAGRLGEPNDETRRLATSAVNLGTAGDYAILTKAGVTTTGATSVNGNVGTSPIASTAITGFGLIMDSNDTFSTSSLVTGNVYAAGYPSPTPSKLTTAISDMETAFVDAAGRVDVDPDNLNFGAGNLEGKTLGAGLYKWGTNVHFTSSLTFSGSSTDIWILQIAQNLDVGNGAQVTLLGGAIWENIYWQVSEAAVFGTTSHVEGIFLVGTAITFNTGSSLNGAALAQTAVTLDAATIVHGKQWPEKDLVGVAGEDAKRSVLLGTVKLDEANVHVLSQYAMMTMDYREDRVRIFVDSDGKVVYQPTLG